MTETGHGAALVRMRAVEVSEAARALVRLEDLLVPTALLQSRQGPTAVEVEGGG